MEPADSIITKLGGVSTVAKAAGVHRTRVSNWKRSRADGGTDGQIPQKHIPALMAHAVTLGVRLDFADFYPGQSEAPGLTETAEAQP
jgi:hypothetical protein